VAYFSYEEHSQSIFQHNSVETTLEVLTASHPPEGKITKPTNEQWTKMLGALSSLVRVLKRKSPEDTSLHLLEQCTKCEYRRRGERGIRDSKWFKWLCRIMYCASLEIGGLLLFYFPVSSGENFLSTDGYIVLLRLLILISLIGAVLLVLTFIFLDPNVQQKETSWKIGKYLSRERLATIWYGFLFGFLMAAFVWLHFCLNIYFLRETF